jgi:hypothetical protein
MVLDPGRKLNILWIKRKLIGSTGWKRLALDQNMWGRNTDETRAQNVAVMP